MKTRNTLHIVLLLAMLLSLTAVAVQAAPAQPQPESPSSAILGPFTSEPIPATVWNGDLRDLPQVGEARQPGRRRAGHHAGPPDPG